MQSVSLSKASSAVCTWALEPHDLGPALDALEEHLAGVDWEHDPRHVPDVDRRAREDAIASAVAVVADQHLPTAPEPRDQAFVLALWFSGRATVRVLDDGTFQIADLVRGERTGRGAGSGPEHPHLR
jgi:hypothetical protein